MLLQREVHLTDQLQVELTSSFGVFNCVSQCQVSAKLIKMVEDLTMESVPLHFHLVYRLVTNIHGDEIGKQPDSLFLSDDLSSKAPIQVLVVNTVVCASMYRILRRCLKWNRDNAIFLAIHTIYRLVVHELLWPLSLLIEVVKPVY